MKGSQIGVEGERESRKQEDRKEKSRTHGTVLKTFKTYESKSSLLNGLSGKQEPYVTLKKNIYRPLNVVQ